MKQVLLIHGAPDKNEFYKSENQAPSNGLWFPWLQKQLALRDELCQSLEFPRPYDPIYTDWVSVFEQMKVSEEAILIGHSCGGGFLLRYLSENKNLKPGKVILIAPWIDPEHQLTTGFFDFEIDPTLSDRMALHILMSSDDEEQLSSFAIIQEKLPNAVYHRYTDREHFCKSEIPEVLGLL
ncbi:MAG: steryl acetyl hydrolase [Candidatus Pacebacteria bacterium]|nr:steryl acetyl hydrolase [Candidatus Paceibacterota bacterium]